LSIPFTPEHGPPDSSEFLATTVGIGQHPEKVDAALWYSFWHCAWAIEGRSAEYTAWVCHTVLDWTWNSDGEGLNPSIVDFGAKGTPKRVSSHGLELSKIRYEVDRDKSAGDLRLAAAGIGQLVYQRAEVICSGEIYLLQNQSRSVLCIELKAQQSMLLLRQICLLSGQQKAVVGQLKLSLRKVAGENHLSDLANSGTGQTLSGFGEGLGCPPQEAGYHSQSYGSAQAANGGNGFDGISVVPSPCPDCEQKGRIIVFSVLGYFMLLIGAVWFGYRQGRR